MFAVPFPGSPRRTLRKKRNFAIVPRKRLLAVVYDCSHRVLLPRTKSSFPVPLISGTERVDPCSFSGATLVISLRRVPQVTRTPRVTGRGGTPPLLLRVLVPLPRSEVRGRVTNPRLSPRVLVDTRPSGPDLIVSVKTLPHTDEIPHSSRKFYGVLLNTEKGVKIQLVCQSRNYDCN